MSFPKVFSSMSIPSFAKTDLRSSIEILPLLSKGKKGTYWRWKTYLWTIFQRLITRRALSNKSKTLEGIFKYSQACIKIQEGFSQVNVHGVSWVIESWRMQIQLINDRIATETRTPLNEGIFYGFGTFTKLSGKNQTKCLSYLCWFNCSICCWIVTTLSWGRGSDTRYLPCCVVSLRKTQRNKNIADQKYRHHLTWKIINSLTLGIHGSISVQVLHSSLRLEGLDQVAETIRTGRAEKKQGLL